MTTDTPELPELPSAPVEHPSEAPPLKDALLMLLLGPKAPQPWLVISTAAWLLLAIGLLRLSVGGGLRDYCLSQPWEVQIEQQQSN